MLRVLLEGFLLGISTGTLCLLTCTPIYLPYLISEDRSLKRSLGKVLEISIGRFLAYLLFGAAAGWLGSNVPQMQRTLFTGISYILLSVFLVVNSLRTHKAEKQCKVPGWMKLSQSAFLLGVFTGVNFCPSFLIALTKSVDLGGTVSGIMLFMGFFAGTTLYLLPMALTALLTVIPVVKKIARILTILIAVWFVWQGAVNINKAYKDTKTVVVSAMDEGLTPYVLTSAQDSLFANALADSLTGIYPERPRVIVMKEIDPELLYFNPQLTMLFITASLWKKGLEKGLESNNYVVIPTGYSIPRAINFLKTYSFKVYKEKGFHWNFAPVESP